MGNSALSGKVSQWIIHAIFIVLCLSIIIPFMLVISISFTEENSLLRNGYKLIPESFSTLAYEVILKNPWQLLNAYKVTALVTVLGTTLSLLLTSMIAYAISRRDFRYHRVTTFYILFTMLFNPGIVPIYILVTQYLHLKDTIWALILPMLLNPFFILVLKGFMDKIPHEVIESAKIDGCSEMRIFYTMVLPLSLPALATVGLFISFMYWNDWWYGLLFIDKPDLVPLQLLLVRIMNTIDFLSNNMNNVNVDVDLSSFPNLSARMAMAVLVAGPMMFVFPFFQRYFVSGITVGSVKG